MGLRVDISAGELVDKITILEIKLMFIEDEAKRQNISKELTTLNHSYLSDVGESSELLALKESLKGINLELWKIEDDIRECERQSAFGDEFIKLARLVYHTNDKRAALKKDINTLTGSELVEEKSYAAY
ncbi:MAG: DUF6165 family protein [Myxococcota bacterium]|jgi:hypothetical protein|nr:DUF6165 family protein [Myxococcota bacterium]